MLFNQGKLENVPIRFEVKNLIKEKSNPVAFGRIKHDFNQATWMECNYYRYDVIKCVVDLNKQSNFYMNAGLFRVLSL